MNDNLDNRDMTLMADGLKGLGYTQQAANTNVSATQMIGYLKSNLTTYYHTGHGNDNYVATSSGSVNASSATINVQNTFFATCLTLSSTNWKNSFGTNAKNILGYTNYSYDFTDDTVVNTVISQLKNSRTYAYAWYYANAGINSLSDRWLVYTREGSSIVEYSARNGGRPKAVATGNWPKVGTQGNIYVAPALLTDSVATPAFKGLQAQHDTVMTSKPSVEFSGLVATSISEQAAIEEAQDYLRSVGLLPSDAAIDKVTQITKRVDASDEPVVVGYQVNFVRVINDIPVRGNGIADHISVMVDDLGVASLSRYWPEIATVKGAQRSAALLSPAAAMRIAANQIARIIKRDAPLYIGSVRMVYGTKGPNASSKELVPAYEFTTTDDVIIVIDAASGDILK